MQVKISDYLWFQEGPGVRNTQYTETGVKLLNVANLVDGKVDITNTSRYISEEEAYGKYKHFLVDDGDFIIASSGIKVEYFDKKMGFVTLDQLPLCMNTSTIRFKVIDKDKLNIRYFMYYLKSDEFKEQLARQITGSAQLNFGPRHLKKMTTPIIDLEEQEELVSNLDYVEYLITARQEQLTKLDELVKSRFVELFGTPLSNEKGWEIKSTGDVCSITDGSHFSPVGKEDGYPMLSVRNMRNDGFRYDDCKLVSQEDYDVLVKQGCKPLKNDVLIAKDGSYFYYGFVVKKEIEQAVLSSIAILRPNLEKIHPEYLCRYMLSSEIVDLVGKNYVTGAAIKRVILKGIKQIPIMLPPMALQNQFATFVKQTDKSKLAIQESLAELETLKKALMQKYFG